MSWKEKMQKAREEKVKERVASRAYAEIVRKRELQARRQEYEKEAINQARIKGKQMAIAKANRPTLMQRVSNIASYAERKVTQRPVPKKRTYHKPVRRAVRRTVYRTRKAPKRRVVYRTAPRRRVVYRRTPARRKVVYRTVREQQPQSSIRDFI